MQYLQNTEKAINSMHNFEEDQNHMGDLPDQMHCNPDVDMLLKDCNDETKVQVLCELTDEGVLNDDMLPNLSPSRPADEHFSLGSPFESVSSMQPEMNVDAKQHHIIEIGGFGDVVTNREEQPSNIERNEIKDELGSGENTGNREEECSITELECIENTTHDVVPCTETGTMEPDVPTSSLGHLEIDVEESSEGECVYSKMATVYNGCAVLKCLPLLKDINGGDMAEQMQPNHNQNEQLATSLPALLTVKSVEDITPMSSADSHRQTVTNGPLELQVNSTQQSVRSAVNDETPSSEVRSTNVKVEVERHIEPSDLESLATCEGLKSECATMTSSEVGCNINLRKKDFAEDYKATIDTVSYLRETDEDQVTVDLSPKDEVKSAQQTAVTKAFMETIKYMRYREAFRKHKRENMQYSMYVCLLTVSSFACLLAMSNHLYGHIGDIFKPAVTYVGNARSYSFDDAPEAPAIYVSLLICMVTYINIFLFGTGTIYYGIITGTIVLLVCYVVTFFCNIITGVTIHSITNELVLYCLRFINLNNRILVNNVLFDNFLDLIYACFLLGANFWLLIQKFIMPLCIAKMYSRGVERLSVASMKPCVVVLPRDSTMAAACGKDAAGYIVEIECSAERCILWRILGYLTRNRVMAARTSTKVYQYVGQLNDRLKPHGYGAWQSSVSSGEVLIGYWENGLPLGAFNSRDMATDARFSNMLLGWAKCRVGGGLSMGIASVETCVNDPTYRSFCNIMKYRAEIFDCENIKKGLIKHTGTHKFKASDENLSNLQSDQIILRLIKATHNFIEYSFKQCDAYIHDIKRRDSAMGKVKDILGDILIQKPGTRHMNAVFKCIFKGMQYSIPYVAPYDELTVASDDNDANVCAGGCGLANATYKSNINGELDGMVSRESIGFENVNCISEQSSAIPRLLGSSMDLEAAVGGSKMGEYAHVPEVCIFVHGPKISTEEQLQSVANIFTPGSYPSYIKPIAFGWPSFAKIHETKAHNYSTIISSCRDVFETFLRSLLNNGVRHAHVVVDPTGAALFLETFALMTENTQSLSIFSDVTGKVEATPNQITLLSVTMMFPEYNLWRFVSALYKPLRAHCNIITIFGKQKNQGRLSFIFRKDGRKLSQSITELFLERSNVIESDQTNCSPAATFGQITLPSVGDDNGNGTRRKKSTMVWLDVDCINVTGLPALNDLISAKQWYHCREICADLRYVYNLYHSYDCRDLIVGCKRAKERITNLDRRWGNVWIYSASAWHPNFVHKANLIKSI
ncbi:hypothetical protein, conserved [Babesia bigemina]|uniref:Uncharacterized protein n=1 Tax=Babesia bigemina TaxID=5866 RepID=A0A061DC47_BABBI|nr:hypothetical protein, conserved [Babesia bigemina]CDR97597.1 hypothetical protein, conserved [Babesia bigemina]|eukprot:XP_012769783.1 hypothetical protein, conserved [Babesia bigemina]